MRHPARSRPVKTVFSGKHYYAGKRKGNLLAVGRLKERYSRVARQYDITVTRDQKGPHAVSVAFERKESFDTASRAAGGYILRTSHTDWDLERIVRTYWRLTGIEDTFRILKSDLGLRSIFHSKDERIEGHMFVSVLAYHAVQLMRTKLKRHNVTDNWGTIQDELRHWQRVTTTFMEKSGDTLIHRQDRRPTDRQRKLAEHLGVSPGKHREQTRIPQAESPGTPKRKTA